MVLTSWIKCKGCVWIENAATQVRYLQTSCDLIDY